MHPGKSKALKIGNVSTNEVTLGNTSLEEVEEFTYLGSIIDKKGGTEADIKARIGKARLAFTQLQKVWKATKVSIKTKIRLFNSNVKSVLMYGCETWTTTKSIVKNPSIHQSMPGVNFKIKRKTRCEMKTCGKRQSRHPLKKN